MSNFNCRAQHHSQILISGILALLGKPSNCGRQASTQHYSLGLLIGTRLKYNLQGHVWETEKLHPSQPDEDIQRKHVASVHFSHNMQHTPSAVHILLYFAVTKLLPVSLTQDLP